VAKKALRFNRSRTDAQICTAVDEVREMLQAHLASLIGEILDHIHARLAASKHNGEHRIAVRRITAQHLHAALAHAATIVAYFSDIAVGQANGLSKNRQAPEAVRHHANHRHLVASADGESSHCAHRGLDSSSSSHGGYSGSSLHGFLKVDFN